MLFFGFIQSCFLKRFHADHLFDNEPIKAVNTCKLITFSYDSRYDAERYYTPYDMGGEYTRQRGRYMDDYATEDLMGEYRKDVRKWADKLKRKDRFNIPKEEIIEQAKKMGVSFNKYDEEEFYTIYLMHISDYPEIANDYYTYVAMAKKWLEDDDIEVSPSEKVCIYMYDIVMGEED